MPVAGNALCFTGVAICNGPEDKAYSQAISQSFRLRSLETVGLREFSHEVRVQTTKEVMSEIARCMSCYHRRQIAPAISYDLE